MRKRFLPFYIAFAISLMSYIDISAQCDFRRTNISSSDFSDQDRADLAELIMEYLSEGVDVSDPNLTRADYPIPSEHMDHFGTIHNTGTPVFLTWHRTYIQRLENWLISKGETRFVPLPYWSPFEIVPPQFFNDADGDGIRAVLPSNHGFADLNSDDINLNPTFYDQYLTPQVCNNFPTLEQFTGPFEGAHGTPHVRIGGTMSGIHSPGAAIFWLWHAWVDEVYYCYQKECMGLLPDLYIRDGENDEGIEPSDVEEIWTSPDIWVRNSNDGFQEENQGESEALCFKEKDDPNNPSTPDVKPVYVYVRVWNRGEMPNEANVGNLVVKWAHGSTGLAWPTPWDGSLDCDGLPLGGDIGSQPLRSINDTYVDEFDADGDGNTSESEKDFTIYEFEWTPPNPDDYEECFDGASWKFRHFCINARIESHPDDPTILHGDFYADLNENNNLALKNISIIGENPIADSEEEEEWLNDLCDEIIWEIIGDPNDPDGVVIVEPDYPTECLLFGNYTQNVMHDVELGIRFKTRRDWELMKNVNVEMFFGGYDWSRVNSENGNIRTRNASWSWTKKSVTWNWTSQNVLIEYPYIRGFTFNEYEVARYCMQFSGQIPMPAPNATTGVIEPIEFDVVQKVNGKIVNGERYKLHVPNDANSSTHNVFGRSINTSNIRVTKEMLIYPNPAKESFTLVTPQFDRNYDVQITNSLGQIVSSHSNLSGEVTISTNDIGIGIYIVVLRDQVSGEIETRKLIIE